MGSTYWTSTMSFPWIALFSVLCVPTLSSVSPILRHIDATNPSGPHFRSFLFPSSLRTPDTASSTHPLPSFNKLEEFRQALPKLEIQNAAVPPEVISRRKPVFTAFASLKEPHEGLVNAKSTVQKQENLGVLENLQITRNSLETFRVELHPEEELVRSG